MSSTVDVIPWPFYPQELHLHGNSIGDEGIRALMAGLSSHKGFLIEHSPYVYINSSLSLLQNSVDILRCTFVCRETGFARSR